MLHSCPFSAVVQVEGASMGVLKRACKANGLPGTWKLLVPKAGDCPKVGDNDIRPDFGTVYPCLDGVDSVSNKIVQIGCKSDIER
jgi:hypothetical protein